ncbi:helix-turn-helix domain-containing protein [Nigerium sp.]|uniref:TetR/AcrR family transcriptional regulator n=1 Tax=Nigerium sp. TaxID=2042655 RepID=UPI003221E4EC
MESTLEPLGRRERNKAAKRARILAAARRGLAEHGYDRMTMAQVARDADVAIGTVFQYAATKPELLMMVTADRWAASVPAAIRASESGGDPVAAIRSMLDPVLEESLADPETTMAIARELLFGGPGPHRDAVVAIVAALETAVAGVLRAAGATDDADAAARLIVSGGLLEVNRTRTGRASRASVEDRLTALITIALRGVR